MAVVSLNRNLHVCIYSCLVALCIFVLTYQFVLEVTYSLNHQQKMHFFFSLDFGGTELCSWSATRPAAIFLYSSFVSIVLFFHVSVLMSLVLTRSISTPLVSSCFATNFSLVSKFRKLVLPTPASPTIINLQRGIFFLPFLSAVRYLSTAFSPLFTISTGTNVKAVVSYITDSYILYLSNLGVSSFQDIFHPMRFFFFF